MAFVSFHVKGFLLWSPLFLLPTFTILSASKSMRIYLQQITSSAKLNNSCCPLFSVCHLSPQVFGYLVIFKLSHHAQYNSMNNQKLTLLLITSTLNEIAFLIESKKCCPIDTTRKRISVKVPINNQIVKIKIEIW